MVLPLRSCALAATTKQCPRGTFSAGGPAPRRRGPASEASEVPRGMFSAGGARFSAARTRLRSQRSAREGGSKEMKPTRISTLFCYRWGLRAAARPLLDMVYSDLPAAGDRAPSSCPRQRGGMPARDVQARTQGVSRPSLPPLFTWPRSWSRPRQSQAGRSSRRWCGVRDLSRGVAERFHSAS